MMLKLREPLFEWADGPAVLWRKFLDGCSSLIERADVTHLDDVPVLILVHPAEGQALGPADVGPVLIDAAVSCLIQERAGAFCMGCSVLQQVGMMLPDVLRLDRENGDVVHAAGAASRSAVEPVRMQRGQVGDLAVNVGEE